MPYYYGNFGRFVNAFGGQVTFAGGNTFNGPAGGDDTAIQLYNPNGGFFENRGRVNFLGDVNFTGIVDNNAGTFETIHKATVSIDYIRALNPVFEAQAIAGEWIARDGSKFDFTRINTVASQTPLLTFRGRAVIVGVDSSLPWLKSITKNYGEITATGGANVALGSGKQYTGDAADDALTNFGRLTVSGGTITLPGTYTQTTTGKLTTTVGYGTPSLLSVGGTATLGGTLITGGAPGFTPGDAGRFDVVAGNTVTGSFAKQIHNGFVSQVTPTRVVLAPTSQAVDLAVSDVTLLNEAGDIAPGTPFAVRFTVRNLTSRVISANRTDAVFLSENGVLDGSARLLSRVADGGLPAFGSRVVTVPLTAPARPGPYSVIVAADSAAKLFDGNRSNNVAAATDPVQIGYANLPLATDVTAAFPAGDTTYYRLTLPAGTGPIRIRASFAGGDAGQVSARFAELPAGNAGDLVGNAVHVGDRREAVIDLPGGASGVYFVAVQRTPGSTAPVMLRADVQSLAITGFEHQDSIRPDLNFVGDTLQLTVHGTGFTPASTFKLGTTAASTVAVVNSTTAVVGFVVPDSGNAPLYASVTNGPASNTYTGLGFSSLPASTYQNQDARLRLANWYVQIHVPSEARPNREVRATITFQNTSSYSQPAPVLQLAAVNAQLRLPSQAYVIGSTTMVLGRKADGGDRYAAVETGSIEVILTPTVTGIHEFFDLTATVLAEQDFVPDLTIPHQTDANGNPYTSWGRLANPTLPANFVDLLRPASISDAAWVNVARPRLEAVLGTTYRSYADSLRTAARVLSLDGADARDVGRLNGYLVHLAEGFGEVENRFTLSAFGRGRSNPYDVRIATDADGNNLVRVGNGFRVFNSFGGGYRATTGERGVLTQRSGGGFLLTEIDGGSSTFRADGKLASTRDALGRTTTFAYTGERLTSITNSVGDVTTLTYNAAGRIVAITDALGVVTTYGYDANGELLTTVASPRGVTTFEYDPSRTGPKAFTRIAETGPDGVRTSFESDALGRLVRQSRGGQNVGVLSYGTGANLGLITGTDALGNITTYLLGEFGKITRSTDALGNVTDVVTDANGRATSVISAAGTVLTPVDADGNTTSATDGAGGSLRFTYGDSGLPTSVRDALGRVTTFEYDARNALVSETDPHGTTTYGTDSAGNPVATVTQGSRITRTTYDAKNLPTRRDYGGGAFNDHYYSAYEYDASRNLTKVTDYDANGANPKSVTLTYDSADRVTSVTYANGKSIQYRYDAAGRLDRLTPSDGPAIDYAYDALGRLSTTSRGGTVEVTYGYDALSRLTTKSFANGTSSVTTYDAKNRVTRIEHRGPTGSVLDFQAYSYNLQGFIGTRTTPDGTTG